MSDEIGLHVLYGIPCSGKSTTAIELAYRNKIRTVIHTDYVREVQRSLTPRQHCPALGMKSHTAWQLFGPPTVDNIITGFKSHVQAVSTGVWTVARKLASDGFPAILEGVHFHGSIIDGLRQIHGIGSVHATLLTVGTQEELLQHIVAKAADCSQVAPSMAWRRSASVMLTIEEWLITDAESHQISITTATDWART